ncbi:hypothetical protein [Saccharopolyspora spinosa]|uniref:hypothetical protein n=1 Tax=Saccharopolyspora spinosa TaxID=60894 RepID=UPI003748C810
MAGAEQYVRGGPMGVAVPVIYQRADGSAHVIAAVHAGDRGEQGRVVLLDAQKGEEAEAADVLAAAGVWVIPVPGAEVDAEVVLPPGGSGLRRLGWGSGLPAVVTGPKRRGGVSGPVAGKAGAKGREEAGEGSRVSKRRKVQEPAAVGAVSGSPGDGGSEVLTPTDQTAQQNPNAERKRKQKERDAKRSRARKAVADRVAVLEELAERGPLTVEQEAELAELRPKVAQRKQKQKESNAKRSRAGKAVADRVAVLEELAEQGPLTVEQEAELAELQPKLAQQWQKQKESNAKRSRARKAVAARIAVLEALAERGPLTVEQEAELAEFQPKVSQRKQKKKEYNARYRRAGKVAAARVAVLEELAEQGPLTVEQEAELAEFQPKVAQQWQKQKEYKAEYRREGRAAVDRVAVLEELAERGPLTVEQEAELAELRPKAKQWQKQKECKAKYYGAGKAAADRVAVLEELAVEGPLTVEQEAELAELRPKAKQWQKQKEYDAERHRARRDAADRVAGLEALKEQGPLTEEQGGVGGASVEGGGAGAEVEGGGAGAEEAGPGGDGDRGGWGTGGRAGCGAGGGVGVGWG